MTVRPLFLHTLLNERKQLFEYLVHGGNLTPCVVRGHFKWNKPLTYARAEKFVLSVTLKGHELQPS